MSLPITIVSALLAKKYAKLLVFEVDNSKLTGS